MANFLSTNPITLSVARELGARNFAPAADFEREGECEDCEFVGEMEFVATGTETAEAECPKCSSTVEIHTTN